MLVGGPGNNSLVAGSGNDLLVGDGSYTTATQMVTLGKNVLGNSVSVNVANFTGLATVTGATA